MEVCGKPHENAQSTSDAICPHCKVKMDSIPKHKKKCLSCGKDIYAITDPFDEQKTHCLKKDDAELLKVIKKLKISEKAFVDAKNRALKGSSVGDIVWGLIGQEKHEAARRGDWHRMSLITFEQARYLYKMGRDYFPVRQLADKEDLQSLLNMRGIHTQLTITTSKDDRVCEKCKALEGKVFTIKKAIEKMPLPVKCESGWCRCNYLVSDTTPTRQQNRGK